MAVVYSFGDPWKIFFGVKRSKGALEMRGLMVDGENVYSLYKFDGLHILYATMGIRHQGRIF